MRVAGILCLAAMPALAEPDWPASPDDIRMLDVLGGQGCVLSAESSAILQAHGFAAGDVDAMASQAQDSGQAQAQRAYIIFDADVCTIRPPEIASRWSVTDPEIQTISPFATVQTSEFQFEDGVAQRKIIELEGCFFEDLYDQFFALHGGDGDAAHHAYLAFLASSLLAGDIRYYAENQSHLGLVQRLNGACRDDTDIANIQWADPDVIKSFDRILREAMEERICDSRAFIPPRGFVEMLQEVPQGGVTQGLWSDVTLDIEWIVISTAAGWHEGASAGVKGVPRPPLCHYPPES